MKVTTAGAVYLFNLGAMTFIRIRRDGSELRRDGENIALVTWPEPVVGKPMELLIRVREDGILTARFTTPVIEIEDEEEVRGDGRGGSQSAEDVPR